MAFPRAHAELDSQWPSAWGSQHRQRPERDVVTLLAEILDGTPHLDAHCAKYPDLFDDPNDRLFVPIAVKMCECCPALRACKSWSRAQPPGSLRGVVGGELYGPT
jgi:hypothetical protein